MIHWPDRFHPDHSPVFVHNERLMSGVNPRAVWAWLIRARDWPSWYASALEVVLEDHSTPDLALGSRFHWHSFGLPIRSTIKEFQPHDRLAWHAQGLGVDAYHAWFIEPRGTNCWVLTEETQHGTLARVNQLLMPDRLLKYHDMWLESLERQAQVGFPT